MIEPVLSVALVLGLIFAFFLIYGLRDALRDTRTQQVSSIQAEVQKQMALLSGHSANIRAEWNPDKRAVLVSVENLGDEDLEVKCFRFLNEQYKVVGELIREYPKVAPSTALTFSLELRNYEGLDLLRLIVTMMIEEKYEEVLVRLPLL
jgi:hypothetical protein